MPSQTVDWRHQLLPWLTYTIYQCYQPDAVCDWRAFAVSVHLREGAAQRLVFITAARSRFFAAIRRYTSRFNFGRRVLGMMPSRVVRQGQIDISVVSFVTADTHVINSSRAARQPTRPVSHRQTVTSCGKIDPDPIRRRAHALKFGKFNGAQVLVTSSSAREVSATLKAVGAVTWRAANVYVYSRSPADSVDDPTPPDAHPLKSAAVHVILPLWRRWCCGGCWCSCDCLRWR